MKGSNEEVGIFSPSRYYDTDPKQTQNRITIAESIGYDLRLIREKKYKGFDPTLLKTFLIGGCFSSGSISAMIDFIKQINPNERIRLIVTDINKEAFQLLKQQQIVVPENIALEMFQGDLTTLGLRSNSVDYVRMDYTQNFIAPNKQTILLQELNRILTNNGIVASMVEILPSATKLPDKVGRFLKKNKGSVVDKASHSWTGYNSLIPSEEFIRDSAKRSHFDISFIESEHPNRIFSESITKLAVFEKNQKLNNFIPLKK